jgi:hypothetical protein
MANENLHALRSLKGLNGYEGITRYPRNPAGMCQRYRLMHADQKDPDSFFGWLKGMEGLQASPNARGICVVRMWPRSWKDTNGTNGITRCQRSFQTPTEPSGASGDWKHQRCRPMPEKLGQPEYVLGHTKVKTTLTASPGTGGTQNFQFSPRRIAETARTKRTKRYRRSLDVRGVDVIQLCSRTYADHARTNDISDAQGD